MRRSSEQSCRKEKDLRYIKCFSKIKNCHMNISAISMNEKVNRRNSSQLLQFEKKENLSLIKTFVTLIQELTESFSLVVQTTIIKNKHSFKNKFRGQGIKYNTFQIDLFRIYRIEKIQYHQCKIVVSLQLRSS